MSFSTEFHAATRSAALEIVRNTHLPEPVRAFIELAIAGLRPADEDKPRVVHVKAHGHLCSGSDYEVSTATIEVQSISVSR